MRSPDFNPPTRIGILLEAGGFLKATPGQLPDSGRKGYQRSHIIHLHAVLGAFVSEHLAHPLVAFLEVDLFDAALFALNCGIGVQRDELTGLVASILTLKPRARSPPHS